MIPVRSRSECRDGDRWVIVPVGSPRAQSWALNAKDGEVQLVQPLRLGQHFDGDDLVAGDDGCRRCNISVPSRRYRLQ
jgi:hypothetical protein